MGSDGWEFDVPFRIGFFRSRDPPLPLEALFTQVQTRLVLGLIVSLLLVRRLLCVAGMVGAKRQHSC
jgi:hypothetical protein